MATINISLPDALRQWVEERIAEGNNGTASEYLRELVRIDQKRLADERLEQLLLEGLKSGEPIAVTPEYLERKREALVARYASRRRAKKTRHQ